MSGLRGSRCGGFWWCRGSSTWIGLIGEVEEGLGGRLRVGREVGRQDEPDLREQVAEVVLAEDRHPLALEPEDAAGLGSGRDPEQDLALQRGHRDLGPEEGLAERD